MSVPIRMPRPKSFTIGEYLTIERKALTKSEFHQGQILAMAGGMPNHNSISSNINGALWSQLRARKCRLFTGDQRVLVAEGEASYYPDVSVTCGEIKYQDRHRDVITNPALVELTLGKRLALNGQVLPNREALWPLHANRNAHRSELDVRIHVGYR